MPSTKLPIYYQVKRGRLVSQVTTGGPLGYPRMAFESRAFTACSPAPGSPLVHGWSCNQLRREIGVVYGNPETTTGEQVVGNKTRVKSP